MCYLATRIAFWRKTLQWANPTQKPSQVPPPCTAAWSRLETIVLDPGCRQQAVRHVSVPAEVRQLLADLRSHLAEKVEPPVYISDRRLVKSVALMQV